MSADIDGFIDTQYRQPLSLAEQVMAGEFQQEAPSIACRISYRADTNSMLAR